jgi:hypothetical protein
VVVQKQAKYMDNKLKALKARNEYLLAIDAANAAMKKYFQEDLPLLVEVTSQLSILLLLFREFYRNFSFGLRIDVGDLRVFYLIQK